MRKYMRRIARYRMEKKGVQRINRRYRFDGTVTSYFAQNWRRVVGAVKK